MSWLRDHAEEVTAVASAIQAAGVVVAVIGVGIAACQIRDARNALRATTMLQIQKDGRDLLGSTDPDVANYIYAYDPQRKYDPVIVDKAQLRIVQILNYYAAASRQHDVGAVDDDMWNSIQREFCDVLTTKQPFQRLWKQAVQNKIYGPNFLEVGNQCLRSAGIPL
jgi:hypothetical protein